MQLARSGIAHESFGRRRLRTSWRRAARFDSRRFGRGPAWQLAKVRVPPTWAEDVKLFATTFIAGFVFVSVLIG